MFLPLPSKNYPIVKKKKKNQVAAKIFESEILCSKSVINLIK